MEVVRGLVRPVLALLGLLTVSTMVYQSKEVPSAYLGLVAVMVGWWFYDRSRGKGKSSQ
jgi:hypothetical protein